MSRPFFKLVQWFPFQLRIEVLTAERSKTEGIFIFVAGCVNQF